MTPDDWRRLADLVEESAGSSISLARLLRLEADTVPLTEATDLPRKGPKPYPMKFLHLWTAMSHIGGIGNSLKGDAYAAWMMVGQPIEGVASKWGDYLASLPDFQTTPKHVGRWLKARGWLQDYQPANARPSATGAATKPIEAPRCPPHRDRVIPPTKMGERWASPGVPCVACKELSAKWGDRHTTEDDLFGRVAK